MKKLLCVICLLALLLSACSGMGSGKYYTHGIYRLSFSVRQISGDKVSNDWDFVYKYNGETIENGYRFLYPLDTFSFCYVQVDVAESDAADNLSRGMISVGITDSSSGKTEITVTEMNGKYAGNTATFEVTCKIKQVGKR